MKNTESRQGGIQRLATYLPAFIGILALVGGFAYCATNSSGHSGFDPCSGSIVFAPIIVAGIALWLSNHRRASIVSVAVGIMGMGFGYYVHHLKIMQQYDFWASEGLQPRNSHSGWLLIFYAILSAIVFLIALNSPKGRGPAQDDDDAYIRGWHQSGRVNPNWLL